MRLYSATAILLSLMPGGVFAQTPAQPIPAQPIEDEEIAMTFNEISQRAGRIEPMLDQLRPNDWIAKGAADTYLAQWTSLRQQFRAIQDDMANLTQHPGQLSESLKALFRLQSTHTVLDSLMAGTRKYQNPALADLIESVASENNADADRFERYVLQIADYKEQQFAVVDREAQRCRATLSRQPAEPARPARKNQ
jgi:ABC-type transporter Mla subunit MlaD